MFDMESIGQKISYLRKKQNMTQMELADRLNISFQAVSNWERGDSMPDISKLPELAKILEVSIDELLGHTSELLEKSTEGEVKEYLQENEVTTEELEEVASMLKPDQVDEIFKHTKPGCLTELSGLAPFISQDVLDEMALKLAKSDDFPYISSLAPFLSKEVIGKLVQIIDAEEGFTALSGLFPFMPQNSLDKMAAEEFAKTGTDNISAIAPFLSKAFLNKLAKEIIEKDGIDALSPIIPFLDQEMLSDYIKKFIL